MVGSNGLSLDKLLLTAKKKRLCLGAACSNKDLEKAGYLAYVHRAQSRGSESRAVKRPWPRLSVAQHVSCRVRPPLRMRNFMLV